MVTHIPFTKRYQSPSDIVELLKLRGLIVKNDDVAKKFIKSIGYYRLSAYLYPFLAIPKENQLFKYGSEFDSAIKLYRFDQELRLLTFRYIADVEIAVRSAMANIIAKETGNIFWITDISMFSKPEVFQKTKNIIDNELRNSNEDFIKHFKHKYSNIYPPSWMLVEVLSIGTLNYIYNNIASGSLRKNIASVFKLSAPVFSSWIAVIAHVRNACAHHSRLWNKVNTYAPVTPKRLSRPWISDTIAKDRIFYPLSILKYFTDIINPDNRMKEQILSLLSRYSIVDTAAMGFPTNWQDEPLWK